MTTSPTHVLDVRHLTVYYRSTRALDDVSFAVDPGTIVALVGVNGAGKSSLLSAITGVIRVHEGSIAIAGMPAISARSRGLVTYVPQSDNIDVTFPVSVYDVVMMGRYHLLRASRKPRDVDHDAVSDALERVGLASMRHCHIGSLSGGQRKRMLVARAIAGDAQLLLLDEPFTGVDIPSQAAIIDVLRALAAENRAILIATHDIHHLTEFCSRAIVLRQRVLYEGAVDEAITHYIPCPGGSTS